MGGLTMCGGVLCIVNVSFSTPFALSSSKGLFADVELFAGLRFVGRG